MSGNKIKKLLKDYFYHYDEVGYAECMSGKTKGKKKLNYLEDAEIESYICNDIANKILMLKPSKYMLNKYPEIEDILNTI